MRTQFLDTLAALKKCSRLLQRASLRTSHLRLLFTSWFLSPFPRPLGKIMLHKARNSTRSIRKKVLRKQPALPFRRSSNFWLKRTNHRTSSRATSPGSKNREVSPTLNRLLSRTKHHQSSRRWPANLCSESHHYKLIQLILFNYKKMNFSCI